MSNLPVEPGCLALFIGCKLKNGGWEPEVEVFVNSGPWHNPTECLHCGSHNLLMGVEGLESGADGCCLCRLRRLDGPTEFKIKYEELYEE